MILGSALLNPVGILAVFLLMPIKMAAARVVFGLLMIFGLVPLIARLHDRAKDACPAPTGQEADATLAAAARSIEASVETRARSSWRAAVKDGLLEWCRTTLDYAVRLVRRWLWRASPSGRRSCWSRHRDSRTP